MGGLYQRALYYKTQATLADVGKGEILFDEESGISLEEQKEILAQLDEVVSQNKITINKDTLTIHARKKGVLFPLLNFLITVVVLVGIFFILQLSFLKRVKAIELDTTGSGSEAETVLAKVREDAERDIKKREEEISRIQGEMELLNSQQQQLKDEMQSSINSRQQELQAAMLQELELEKQRLQEQGIAVVDIEDKLKELEAKKQADFKKEMEEYAAAAEAKRRADEEQLSGQINSLQSSLSAEKQRMDTIRTEAAAKQKELEALYKKQQEEQAVLDASLQEKKNELAVLAEERRREQLVNDQITGFYNTIEIAFSEANLSGAKAQLKTMKDFFTSQEVLNLPGIASQRERNLFLLSVLEDNIDNEEAKAQIDTASLMQKAAIVSNINNKFQEAEQKYKNNETEAAQKLYEEALGIIPGIKESYLKSIQIDEAKRTALYNNYLKEADALYKSRDFAKAITGYANAIRIIPGDVSEERVNTMMTNILEAGYHVKGDTTEKAAEEKAAKALLAQAETLFTARAYTEAITKYLDLLLTYPRSDQVAAAQAGIRKSLTEIQTIQLSYQNTTTQSLTQLEATVKTRDQTIADLNQQLARNVTDLQQLSTADEENLLTIRDLNSRVRDQDAVISEQDKTIDEKVALLAERDKTITDNKAKSDAQVKEINLKQAELTRLQTLEVSLRATISELQTTNRALQSKVADLEKQLLAAAAGPVVAEQKSPETEATGDTSTEPVIPESIQKDMEFYQALQKQLEELISNYYKYTQIEDNLLLEKGSLGYLSSRPLLGEILSSDFVSGVMPDLYERIKNYEDALAEDAIKAGTSSALESVLEIIDAYNDLPVAANRTNFWNSQRQTYKGNTSFLEILDELEYLLSK